MPVLNRPISGNQEIKGVEYTGAVGSKLAKGQLCYLRASNGTSFPINGKSNVDMGYGYTFTKQIKENNISGVLLFDITTDGTTPYLRGRFLSSYRYPYDNDTLFTNASVDNAVRLVDIPNFETKFINNPNQALRVKIFFLGNIEVASGSFSNVVLFLINSGDNKSLIHFIKISNGQPEYLKTFEDTYNWNGIDVQIAKHYSKELVVSTSLTDSTCTVNVYSVDYNGIAPLTLLSDKKNTFTHQGAFYMYGHNLHLQNIPVYVGDIGYFVSFLPYENTKDATIFSFYYLQIYVDSSQKYYELRSAESIYSNSQVVGNASITCQYFDNNYYITTSDGAGWNGEYNYCTTISCTNLETSTTKVPNLVFKQEAQREIDNKMNPAGWKRYLRAIIKRSSGFSFPPYISFYGNGNSATPLQTINGQINNYRDENISIGEVNFLSGTDYNELILRENSVAMIYNGALNDSKYPKIECYSYVLAYEIRRCLLGQSYPNVFVSKEDYSSGYGTVVFPEY